MKPMEKAQEEAGAGTEQAYSAANAVQVQPGRDTASENAQNVQTAAFDGSGAENGVSDFRMQQAINAYEMFMTA